MGMIADAAASGNKPFGPSHVAIIMDGNGRWAQQRRLPRLAGHRAGVRAVRAIVEHAARHGLPVLTLYAFSSENWKRPEDEVGDLMGLLRAYVRSELRSFVDNGIRLRIIGNWRALAPDIVAMLKDALAKTAQGTRLTLVVALNYGAQDEIVRAASRIVAEHGADALTVARLEAALDTGDLPPPDLIIRTSGEQRLSNFLLWQAAYAELYFTPMLWPDFTVGELDRALADFAARERRFGGR